MGSLTVKAIKADGSVLSGASIRILFASNLFGNLANAIQDTDSNGKVIIGVPLLTDYAIVTGLSGTYVSDAVKHQASPFADISMQLLMKQDPLAAAGLSGSAVVAKASKYLWGILVWVVVIVIVIVIIVAIYKYFVSGSKGIRDIIGAYVPGLGRRIKKDEL